MSSPIRRALRLVLAVLLAALLAAAAHAVDEAADEPDDEAATEPALPSPAEAARLRELLQQPAPAGRGPRKRLFEAQYVAVVRLRLPPQQVEVFLRRWAIELPRDPRPSWELAMLLMNGDDRDQAYATAERAIELAAAPHQRVQYRAQFAINVLADGDFERAESLLAQAESLARSELAAEPQAERAAWLRLRALTRLQSARCVLDRQVLRHERAVDACRQAAASAGELARRRGVVDERTGWHGVNDHLKSQLRLVEALTAAGQHHGAERAWLETGRLYDGYGRPRSAEWQLRGAQLRVAQGRLDEAAEAAQRALEGLRAAAGAAAGSDAVLAARVLLNVRVQQKRWSDAQALLDELDRATAGQSATTRRIEWPALRTLVYLRFGRAGALEPQLRAALDATVRRTGETGFLAGHHRALLALALLAQPDEARRASGRAELRRALPELLAPRGLEGATEDHSLWSLVREAALQRFLDELGDVSDDAAVSLGLQVADVLRGSSVQEALTQAAARGAAQTAGLAEIVRRDQDARNELQSLVQFIGRLSADSAPRRLDGVLAQMKRRIAALEAERAALREQITRQFPDYGQLVHPSPPAAGDISRLLEADEVFVALLPAEDHVHVWAVDRQGASYRRVALAAAELQQLVRRVRATLDVAALGRRMPAFDAASARALQRALLEPLAGRVTHARHVIVAAGGALGQLPFAVLPEGEAAADGSQPWLLRRAAVSHVASASAWATLRRVPARRPAPEALAGWGDPRFASGASPAATKTAARALTLRAGIEYGRIPPLPDTRDELLAIADTLQADRNADLFLAERATRASVLQASASGWLGRKRVVVFATHGLMSGDLPELQQPALALANDGSGDTDALAPLLTLQDVLGLRLQADWVVLSACNTAAGDGRSQEALSGLARGFFYAGTRSLLVTHWAVESESATQLTTRTFAHRREHPGARKAESLRQAALQVMAQPRFAHPAYWAPYALVGDGGP